MTDHVQLMLVLAGALLATGLVGGVLAGLLGVGGGIVLVPALFYVFGFIDGVDPAVKMHLAVGTSLASMIPTSIRSALAHRAKGGVDEVLFKHWIPGILIGTTIGSLTAAHMKGPVLMGVFAVFATIVAIYMAFGKENWRIESGLPGRIGQTIIATLISGISVMMGIGGGTFTVPTLTLFGYPIHRAVGTAAAIGVLIAIPGAIGFVLSGLHATGRPPWSFGYANLIGMATIVPATVIAAPWGAMLAHKLNRIWLRRAFALFLGITGLKMGMSLLGTL
jgi:uncharacterized membrane protein YfcA